MAALIGSLLGSLLGGQDRPFSRQGGMMPVPFRRQGGGLFSSLLKGIGGMLGGSKEGRNLQGSDFGYKWNNDDVAMYTGSLQTPGMQDLFSSRRGGAIVPALSVDDIRAAQTPEQLDAMTQMFHQLSTENDHWNLGVNIGKYNKGKVYIPDSINQAFGPDSSKWNWEEIKNAVAKTKRPTGMAAVINLFRRILRENADMDQKKIIMDYLLRLIGARNTQLVSNSLVRKKRPTKGLLALARTLRKTALRRKHKRRSTTRSRRRRTGGARSKSTTRKGTKFLKKDGKLKKAYVKRGSASVVAKKSRVKKRLRRSLSIAERGRKMICVPFRKRKRSTYFKKYRKARTVAKKISKLRKGSGFFSSVFKVGKNLAKKALKSKAVRGKVGSLATGLIGKTLGKRAPGVANMLNTAVKVGLDKGAQLVGADDDDDVEDEGEE